MSRGFSFMVCYGWSGHVLNALAPKCSSIQYSNWCLLLSVGVNRMSAGLGGVVVLQEHPHRAFPLLLMATFCCEVRVGKSGGSSRSSRQILTSRTRMCFPTCIWPDVSPLTQL